MIRILIVDDEALVRQRLWRIAERVHGQGVCNFAGSLSEARAALSTLPVDLLLLDVGLPDGSGISLLPWVREHVPTTEVVVISSVGDDGTVLNAIRAGAVGYLLKNGDDAELELSLASMKRGGAPIDPVIARRILRQLQAEDAAVAAAQAAAAQLQADALLQPSRARPELTERERQVLQRVAQGESNRDIAESLGVSLNTVEFHAKNIFRKLEVRTRSAAVFSATRHGWLN